LVNGIGFGSPTVCPGEGVTTLQEARVVVKYLEDNPAILNLNESFLPAAALAKAFPCSVKWLFQWAIPRLAGLGGSLLLGLEGVVPVS
jgi:hypothetical protein